MVHIPPLYVSNNPHRIQWEDVSLVDLLDQELAQLVLIQIFPGLHVVEHLLEVINFAGSRLALDCLAWLALACLCLAFGSGLARLDFPLARLGFPLACLRLWLGSAWLALGCLGFGIWL